MVNGGKRSLLVAVLLAAVGIAALFTQVGNAGAASCGAGRAYCNADEQRAYNICTSIGWVNEGAIWMNNSGSAATSDGYYNIGINVPHDATTVTAYVRGSVYGCGVGGYANKYASHVSIKGSYAGRFTTTSSALFRGTGQGAWAWSTKGGSAVLSFNTSGLAPSTTTKEGKQTISVGIYRCFSLNGTSINGSCDTSWQNITITRSKKPVVWSLTPTVSISSGNRPGQTLTWTHSFKNNGPNTTNKSITYRGMNGSSVAGTWTASSIANGKTATNRTTSQLVRQSDVGNTLCRATSVSPRSSTNNATLTSGNGCRAIPYNYTLTPSIDAGSVPNIITDSQSIQPKGSVVNSGPTKTYQTDVRYVRTVNPTRTTAGSSTGAIGCGYYGGTRCQVMGNYQTIFNSAGTNGGAISNASHSIGTVTDSVPDDLKVGDRVCYGLAVTGYNAATGSSKSGVYYSALRCARVGKLPKVQVWGGNVQVGRTFGGIGKETSLVETSVTKRTVLVDKPPYDPEGHIEDSVWNVGSQWRFGKGAGLTFNKTGAVTESGTSGKMDGNEGTTVAVNEAGVVQFMTDGLKVYRPNGAVMDGGNGGLGATSSTTQAAAVFPIKDNKYVIVTSSAASECSVAEAVSNCTRPDGVTGVANINRGHGRLRYSIVDMSMNGGVGKVTLKNRVLISSDPWVGEALTVTIHANNDAYWVVTNRPGTSTMYAVRVDYGWNAAGGVLPAANLRTSVVGLTGDNISGGDMGGRHAPGFGTINFDKEGKRVVVAMQRTMPGVVGVGSAYGTIRVLDFNTTSGDFSPLRAWRASMPYVYSADFSPQGRYVYATSLYNSGIYGQVYRYTFMSGSTVQSNSQIQSSRISLHTGSGLPGCGASGGGGQVKRGPDGRMYIADHSCTKIGVISSPDSANPVFQKNSRSIGSGATSAFGLPQTAAILPVDRREPTKEQQLRIFGSWSEYSILAPSSINLMASSSGLVNGSTNENQSAWSKLTYTRPKGSGSYGYYNAQKKTLPDISQAFPVAGATGIASGQSRTPEQLAAAASGSSVGGGRLTVTGTNPTLTISGGSLGKGRWVVINAPSATVTISGNITYQDGPFTTAQDIPQLIIIAKYITINSNVTNVDAWLIAKNQTATDGAISTCNTSGTAPQLSAGYTSAAYNLSSNQCNQPLTINGPVIANRLFLRRTAGSDPGGYGNPAEVINLRPDSYLWAQAMTTSRGIYTTTALREVPPRY